jgi:hypothetical protein
MPHAIVTGADRKYFPYLDSLIKSIVANVKRTDIDICVYDFGLSDEQKENLASRVSRIVTPSWDFDFPFLANAPDYKKATTVPPFTPKYFPGYETYIWIDADVWCQTPEAIDLFIRGAKKGRLAIVPEVDRSFPSPIASGRTKVYKNIPFLKGHRKRIVTWMYLRFLRLYDREIANTTLFKPTLNAGIYALPADAPHWDLWAESFRKARFKMWERLTDQGPLNHAYYTTDFPVEFLPAWCNWTCHSKIPSYDAERKLFVEPFLPHHPISFMHLVNNTKTEWFEIENTDGGKFRGKLTYEASTELLSATGFVP